MKPKVMLTILGPAVAASLALIALVGHDQQRGFWLSEIGMTKDLTQIPAAQQTQNLARQLIDCCWIWSAGLNLHAMSLGPSNILRKGINS